MNSKILSILRNFSHTLLSNLVSFVISVLVIAVVPKLIGVEAYGYWQLYMFYILYVGFLHFGWCDGIYLRYGGYDYKQLDKSLFYSQFYSLLILQLIMAAVVLLSAVFVVKGPDKIYVVKMTSLSLVAMNMRWMLLYLFQATNRIKPYANSIMTERLLYLVLLIVALTLGVRNYRIIIWADVIGKYVSLFYAVYCCRDFIFKRISRFYFTFSETWQNISVGIKLMFSNIASMLIVGSVRFGIERSWDVSTFGKVSLTLSVSNMLMLFINALGLVLYPVLRRTEEKRLPEIYMSLRNLLMPLLFTALLIYYPAKEILSLWLPQYADSLLYMSLLFPVFVFEGKMALLVNTYLKTLRKEKMMLRINILFFLLSAIVTFIFTVLYQDLDLLIASIPFVLAFRSIALELFLFRSLKISPYRDLLLELALTILFVLFSWFIDSWISVFAYALSLLVYFFIKRRDLQKSIILIKTSFNAS